jgi:hypothetical protein
MNSLPLQSSRPIDLTSAASRSAPAIIDVEAMPALSAGAQAGRKRKREVGAGVIDLTAAAGAAVAAPARSAAADVDDVVVTRVKRARVAPNPQAAVLRSELGIVEPSSDGSGSGSGSGSGAAGDAREQKSLDELKKQIICPICQSDCKNISTTKWFVVRVRARDAISRGRSSQILVLRSGHCFCGTCIAEAVKLFKSCPTCRRKLGVKDVHRIYL